MAKNQYNVEKLKAEAVKPLFAVAGATELAVDFARSYASDAQKTAQERLDAVQARVSKVDRDPKALQGQARKLVNQRLDELTKDARKAQARFEARLKDLQKDAADYPKRVQSQIDDAIEELADSYADLAKRGEKFVSAIRKDGVKALTAVKKAPSKSTVAKRERAVAAAKKSPAKKAPAKKASAKKAPARKSSAKKTTTRKSTQASA
jgi:signal transduction protein with GAF and PtsI domain